MKKLLLRAIAPLVLVLGMSPTQALAVDGQTTALLLFASSEPSTGATPFEGHVEWSLISDGSGTFFSVGEFVFEGDRYSGRLVVGPVADSTTGDYVMRVEMETPLGLTDLEIVGMPGILLKNELLIQGAPLEGSAERLITNVFTLQLSSEPLAKAKNRRVIDLEYIDIALIQRNGKRALVTLKKDQVAAAYFGAMF